MDAPPHVNRLQAEKTGLLLLAYAADAALASRRLKLLPANARHTALPDVDGS